MPEEVTLEEQYARFRHASNQWYYAFVLVPAALLELSAPPEARNSIKSAEYDADGNVIDGTQVYKNMHEYLAARPLVNESGSEALVLLNEALAPRMTGVTVHDLAFWDEHLQAYGLGSEAWLTIEEMKELEDFS